MNKQLVMRKVLYDLLEPEDGYERLLRAIFRGPKTPTNFSNKELISAIRSGLIPVPLAEEDKGRIREVIDSLDIREANIVREYFGIEQKLKKVKEIAQEHGLSEARVRQIKDKAVQRLRHSSRSDTLRDIPLYWKDIREKADNFRDAQKKLEEVEKDIVKYKEAAVILAPLSIKALEEMKEKGKKEANVLKRSVGTLGFSIRTSNCLRDLGVQTIGDLCSYREDELLKSKNFGRKSLFEIKETLADLNLSLKDEYTS